MTDTARGSAPGGPPGHDRVDGWRREYWRKNLRLMVVLLSIWFVVSFVCGVLLIEPLNGVVILGFPLGLWFAQQGSIYTFVILVGVYALRMDKLDDEFGVSERDGEGNRL
ncbi:DUF4212 domain-containing protein [Isoptericola variabilis]|uniref:Putative solute symporter protein n=1 Tax=Isoptericola variabilis (strain 225) TaxID=743718 RepID=F6FQE6_ISOV2|nr:DUF4212 domain-containing protein [Isoptericola variabilis]AEG43821.1 putative solute symporter protein [Isoptericola variabilis 225]TWH34121.1 putative solute:sodium symporter small subunit [Isoptericola variabilis J7]